MSVVLNQPGLFALLDAPEGPLGIDLARRAEAVKQLAIENASGAIIGVLTDRLRSGITAQVEHDGLGLRATVSTPAEEAGFFYPAYWDQNGRPWLTTALRDGFRV